MNFGHLGYKKIEREDCSKEEWYELCSKEHDFYKTLNSSNYLDFEKHGIKDTDLPSDHPYWSMAVVEERIDNIVKASERIRVANLTINNKNVPLRVKQGVSYQIANDEKYIDFNKKYIIKQILG